MENNILLSICIPTYNRADVLRDNLGSLLNLESFDETVEVVISDNNSSDCTYDVVNELKARFPNKRIVYSKNKENIRDKNFFLALSLGSGHYLKLMNDYTSIDEQGLSFMKSVVANCSNNIPLFFYDRLRARSKVEDIHSCDMDNFVKLVNNKITWISNFGCWRDQLSSFSNFYSFADKQLLQVYWSLYLVSINNCKHPTPILAV